MVVGSYLIGSTHMRIHDETGSHFIGPDGPLPAIKGRLTSTNIKERVDAVFQLPKRKMKNLAIVNSTFADFAMIRACVEVAEKHAENVMVIPPLLARVTYAFEDLAKLRNPPEKEVLLVVTVTSKFVDFVILRRDQNLELHIVTVEIYQTHQCKDKFKRLYDHFYPHSTIFLNEECLLSVAKEIQSEFQPENCFIKPFKKWDFILLLGGVLWSKNDEDGFDPRYHVTNFSSGYETTIQNRQMRTQERYVLLPERSALPCNIHGFNGQPHQITIFYKPEYYQTGNELVLCDREATKYPIKVTGSAKEIIGYVDERGVPYAPYPKALLLSKKIESPTKITVSQKRDPSVANISYAAMLTANKMNNVPLIKFVFRDNFYAIQVLQNGSTRFLTDSSGNEWTPMYLSMAEGKPEIGEKAKNDYHRFPKRVIYDVLKIIGHPLNEIRRDPRWGFELSESGGNIHFQVQTPSGPRRIPQELVLSAFLKAMKLQTQSSLETQIKEIRLSTDFELSESQKAVFAIAAEKNEFKILM